MRSFCFWLLSLGFFFCSFLWFSNFPLEVQAEDSSSLPYTHPEFPSKVSHDLRVTNRAGINSRANDHSNLFSRDKEERILISVVHDVLDENQRRELVEAIEALGGKMEAFATRLTDAYLPLGSLESLAERPEVKNILAQPPPIVHAGSVTSQVVSTLNIISSSLDGTGIKVGVISDSVSRYEGGLSDSITTGNLPPIERNTILKDGDETDTDEARAMAEIVYDIAPGVDFLYYMPSTPADFATGIAAMVSNGVRVIVDDLSFLNQPVYQDSIIAQAANAANAAGVVYVSSAGNRAHYAYEAPFSATTNKITFNFGSYTSAHYCHQFSEVSGNGRLDISSVPGAKRYTLHWKCPFFTLGGKTCGVDLDFITADWSTTPPTVLSSALNSYTDAYEYLSFTSTSISSLSICLKSSAESSAANYNGSPVTMKLNFWSTDSLFGLTGSPTVLGHHNAAGAISVAAITYAYTCRGPYLTQSGCGSTLPVPIYYSSMGGQEIWFDDDGDLLVTPEVRLKPDVSAAHCGDTSFFGTDLEPNGFPNFCGTSAAAPAVAGVVALLLQECPSLTPSQVVEFITSTATNVFPVGFDYYAGWGQIDTQGALDAITSAGCASTSLSATLTVSPSSSKSITPSSSSSKSTSPSTTSTRTRSPSLSTSRTPSGSVSLSVSGTPTHSITITSAISRSGAVTSSPSATQTPSNTITSSVTTSMMSSYSVVVSGSPSPLSSVTKSTSKSLSGSSPSSWPSSSRSTSQTRSRSRSRSRSPTRSGSRSRSRSRASISRSISKTKSRTRSRTRTSPSKTRTRSPTRSV